VSRYVVALDQGTTSTRCLVFDHDGVVVAAEQREHQQILPRPGWVEHDPQEIWARTLEVIARAMHRVGAQAADVAAVGIANQRETTIVWDKASGQPICNALVWQDTRTADICRTLLESPGEARFRSVTGLPVGTYFSGPKLKWILGEVAGAKKAADRGDLLFGTVDTWLLWNLTGEHVTDVTNASRTLLMDLESLDWDEDFLHLLEIPPPMLPKIVDSTQVVGRVRADSCPELQGVPVCAALGDQQAALFGQACYRAGEAKNTYGTGCFLLLNTGERRVASRAGLITTVGYKLADHPPVYALEGSIAIAGALVQWLRDNLGLIRDAKDIEELASSVPDNGGLYFVPAFSGLFAPHWRLDARGVIVGLSRFANKGHLARSVLEATAFQTRDVLEAMQRDLGVSLKTLKVDGGMVANELLMQFQADILNATVVRPSILETTALGAAYMAGLSVGFWSSLAELEAKWHPQQEWRPQMAEARRAELYASWQKAVPRSFGWLQ
jgi:glycerol kinase